MAAVDLPLNGISKRVCLFLFDFSFTLTRSFALSLFPSFDFLFIYFVCVRFVFLEGALHQIN